MEEHIIIPDADEEEEERVNPMVYAKVGGKKILYFLGHPSLVWFYTLYLSSLTSMVVFNVFRKGFNEEGLLGGPSYYANLFWYYGLNQIPKYNTPWAEGALAWISAPFLAVFLGVPLYFLMEAGWSPDVFTAEKELGNMDYAFFAKSPYGYKSQVWGTDPKNNLFFIGIVWLPIIVASIMLVLYKKRVDREVHPVYQFVVGFFIAFFIGLEFARISVPDFTISIAGGIESITKDRFLNKFILGYDGNYHPTSTAMMMALFHIATMITGLLVDSAINSYKKVQEYMQLRQLNLEKKSKTSSGQELTVAPWIIERQKRKEEYEERKKKKKKKGEGKEVEQVSDNE